MSSDKNKKTSILSVVNGKKPLLEENKKHFVQSNVSIS
jgi:hypothetical protein